MTSTLLPLDLVAQHSTTFTTDTDDYPIKPLPSWSTSDSTTDLSKLRIYDILTSKSQRQQPTVCCKHYGSRDVLVLKKEPRVVDVHYDSDTAVESDPDTDHDSFSDEEEISIHEQDRRDDEGIESINDAEEEIAVPLGHLVDVYPDALLTPTVLIEEKVEQTFYEAKQTLGLFCSCHLSFLHPTLNQRAINRKWALFEFVRLRGEVEWRNGLFKRHQMAFLMRDQRERWREIKMLTGGVYVRRERKQEEKDEEGEDEEEEEAEDGVWMRVVRGIEEWRVGVSIGAKIWKRNIVASVTEGKSTLHLTLATAASTIAVGLQENEKLLEQEEAAYQDGPLDTDFMGEHAIQNDGGVPEWQRKVGAVLKAKFKQNQKLLLEETGEAEDQTTQQDQAAPNDEEEVSEHTNDGEHGEKAATSEIDDDIGVIIAPDQQKKWRGRGIRKSEEPYRNDCNSTKDALFNSDRVRAIPRGLQGLPPDEDGDDEGIDEREDGDGNDGNDGNDHDNDNEESLVVQKPEPKRGDYEIDPIPPPMAGGVGKYVAYFNVFEDIRKEGSKDREFKQTYVDQNIEVGMLRDYKEGVQMKIDDCNEEPDADEEMTKKKALFWEDLEKELHFDLLEVAEDIGTNIATHGKSLEEYKIDADRVHQTVKKEILEGRI